MNSETRDRILLPIGIPLGAAVLILAVVLTVSRVLLAVPPKVAVAVALMLALNILAVGAIVTVRPRLRSIDFAFLAGVAAVPVVAGLFVAAGAIRVSEGEEEKPPPQPQRVAITAQNALFTTNQLTFKAGSPVVITLDNKDSLAHDLSIYRTPEDAANQENAVLEGTTFTGPGSKQYRSRPIPQGTYVFQCDVHPTTMKGTVTVEAAPAVPSEPQKPVEIALTATNVAFDKTQLSAPGGVPVTIDFDNKTPSLIHNVAIYATPADADGVANPLFQGDLITGPVTHKYQVKPLKPGTYVFQCDVHFTSMRGTLTVT
jgi:plastocyanin